MDLQVNPKYYEVRDKAEALVDDLVSYVDKLDWRAAFTDEQKEKIEKKLTEIATYVDDKLVTQPQKPGEEYAAVPDGDRAYQWVTIDNPYYGFYILYAGGTLQDVKNKASLLIGNLDVLLTDFTDTEYYKKYHKQWEFYKQRAQFVLDYQGDPKGVAPNWSVLVDAPFWQYPPPKAKTTMWWPWLLAVAVIVGIGYAQTKKDK